MNQNVKPIQTNAFFADRN